MQSTLAFAPSEEDLEDDFFGIPAAAFALPPQAAEEAQEVDIEQARAA